MIRQWLEQPVLRVHSLLGVEGTLCFDHGVMDQFYAAPYDVCPGFEGPPGYPWKDARGKDHPRLGRFVYAFAKHYQPNTIVEVGTNTGGTAIGWVRALQENGKGRLICVDNDAYSHHSYPRGIQINMAKQGIPTSFIDLRNGDSTQLIPQMAQELKGAVDIYLVDGDHRYEGALADMENGLPMVKKGGFILVHDVDRFRHMTEATTEHPKPVYEAFRKVAKDHGYQWCLLRFIRKHLGIIRIS